VTLRRSVRGWLLWLALLLPIAQAMAGVHALSHVGEQGQDGLVHAVDCDLCVTAAHLAGAVPAAAPVLPRPPVTEAVDTPGAAPAPVPAAAWRPPVRGPPASA
jgi:hypothetical protein